MVVADAADGISDGAGTADVVAFFARDEDGALRVNDARFAGFEDGHEAFAGDLGMNVNARSFEEGGCKVNEIDEVVNYSVRFNRVFPHGGQWHVVSYFVELAFHARKGHAIVRGDHDEGVVEFAAFFEDVEDLAQVFVEPFDFKGVVEHVVFDVFGCWPAGGYFVDVREGFSPEAHARAVFVAAVGFSAAIPEAEGLVVGFGIEKSREIGGVVYIGDAFCGGIEFVVVVFGTDEFAR